MSRVSGTCTRIQQLDEVQVPDFRAGHGMFCVASFDSGVAAGSCKQQFLGLVATYMC